ncbi:MAG: radical SAM protein, partial [Deltaproteobacteria bacterium]|nr:radical SAM protein [Deltaproteobacteria bacterium]
MSNLGFQIVYHLLNESDTCVAERAFLPSREDAEEFLRSKTPLFSYESLTKLKEFDIVAFSVSFEEDFFNIPAILALAGIPVFSKERDENQPLVMAGGIGVSLNPEP